MRRLFIILLICSLTSACGIFDIRVDREGTATTNLEGTAAALSTQYAHLATQVQAQATAVALATYVPYLSTQIGSLRLTPIPPGGVLPTASPLLPPPGLVYSASDGLWQVDNNSNPYQLSDRRDAMPSPDGQLALFLQVDSEANTDLWIIDLGSGEERQLTDTSDRLELFGRWWPGQLDKVILGSRPTSEDPEPSTGYLSMVSLDTGEYLILDGENASNAFPAPSPSGQRIAYDRGGSPWIYDLVSGPEAFDLDSYDSLGISGSQKITLASPSWSPDGKQLAWVIGGGLGQDASYRIAIAVFNLETRKTGILHPYSPVGRGGWPPAPVWSPDGQWLAFNSWSEENPNALWVVRPDGSDERYLGEGSNPVWSPDSNQLAFTRYGELTSLWLAQVGEWKAEQVHLPLGAKTVDWLPPAE